jgi:hypothetical protein
MIKEKKLNYWGNSNKFFITSYKKILQKSFVWKNYFGEKKHAGLM